MTRPPSHGVVATVLRRARTGGAVDIGTLAGQPWTLGGLDQHSARLGAALVRCGIERGDRVVVVLPNGPDFLVNLLAVLRIGAVVVPLAPGSGFGRVARCAARVGARVWVVAPSRADEVRLAAAGDERCREVLVVSADLRDQAPCPERQLHPDDLALLQFTSGSTGEPKAVAISHGNLATNIAQMVAGFEISADDVFSSWLPAFHDMGLILMLLTPLVVGAELHLDPTGLAGIRGWFDQLTTRRATVTAAPDFAYRLALRLGRDEGRHDLSRLRLSLNAAEPVRATTVEELQLRFGLERVVVAGYGLAEATVGVTASPVGKELAFDPKGAVGLGRGFPGVELATESAEGQPCRAGEIGEVLVRSPARALGYYDDPVATAAVFRTDGWLATGDLGYLDEAGELFVVGRLKDMISIGGGTLAPRELEELVDRLPFVRRSAAVGIEPEGREGELAYLFVEVTGGAGQGHAERSRQITEVIRRDFGFGPGRVYLLRPGSLPRTPNGKLQRQMLVEAYRSGTLHAEGRIVFPPPGAKREGG